MKFAVLVAFTLALHAQQPAANLDDTCGKFAVRMHSRSGDPMADDMRVVVAFGDKEAEVKLPAALYTPRTTLQNVTNLCTQLTALDAGGGNVVLLLARSGRPSWDELDAVLIDAKGQRILDARSAIGQIKSEHAFAIRKVKDGFELRLIREFLHGCDCAEDAIEDWMRLEARGGKIAARWSRN